MTPKQLAERVLLAYPLVVRVSAWNALLARERIIAHAVYTHEEHQKIRKGCKCNICASVIIAIAGWSGDAEVPAAQRVISESPEVPT